MSFIMGFIAGGMVTYYRKQLKEWINSLDEKADEKDNEEEVSSNGQ